MQNVVRSSVQIAHSIKHESMGKSVPIEEGHWRFETAKLKKDIAEISYSDEDKL